MKMKLKFQQGGAAPPPFITYNPIMVTAPAATLATATSSKEDLTDKDLLNMLEKLDGLPSDMAVLTRTLQNFNLDQRYGKINTANIATKYISILNQLKVANFNKKEYDNAYELVKSNGGLNEIAISDRGQLYCMNNEGDFKLLGIDDLENNSDYTPLTNSELLYFRAQSSNLANKNDILKVVKNGIGMDSIHKLINQAITVIGSQTESDSGYIMTDSKKLISGLQDYIKIASTSQENNISINNLYKTKLMTKDQAEQAKLAIDYIWKILPTNAQTLLRTKSSDGSIEGGKQLIGELIVSRTNSTREFDATLDSSKGKSSKGSGGSGSDTKNDPVKSFILGLGYSQPIGINIGNSYTHTVNGRYGILTDKSGNALGANSTFEDVTGSAFAGVLDLTNATFGGVKLNTNQSRKILLDGADIIGMDLPIDQEAKQRGIIRPDLNLLSRLEEAENEIRYNNISNPEQINEIYSKYNLPEKFKNENGEYNLNLLNYQRFARLSGVVEESALPEDIDLDNTIQAITDDNLRESIEEVFKSKDDNYSMRGGVFGWNATELFRGAIYIPVRENLISASLGSGDYYKLEGDDANQVERDWEQTQKIQSYQKPPSLGTLS